MTHAEAAELLERMCAADTDPELSLEDIEMLLRSHRTLDRYGIAPGRPGWEPTWDLNAAAAEGWRWKAGRCSGRFAFSADGASYSRDQVMQHCLDQAALYSRRVIRSLNTSPYLDGYQFEGDLL